MPTCVVQEKRVLPACDFRSKILNMLIVFSSEVTLAHMRRSDGILGVLARLEHDLLY